MRRQKVISLRSSTAEEISKHLEEWLKIGWFVVTMATSSSHETLFGKAMDVVAVIEKTEKDNDSRDDDRRDGETYHRRVLGRLV